MRLSIVLLGAAALLPAATSIGQDSLCNPRVDPPSHLLQDDSIYRSTSVFRAEDLQRLGIPSVADMVRQLPGNMTDSACPVTQPEEGPAFSFDGNSNGWSGPLWYGTRSLSVNLRLDGTYAGGDKFFWYSEGFRPEQASELEVSIQRLDNGPMSALALQPTNALFDNRWHILTGINFPDPGCWEITGTYRGQMLRFVVESVAP